VRFLLFDRILDAERGRYIKASKLVNLADGHLAEHYPRSPVFPASLVVEGLAQLGGMLNFLNHDFAVEMVLMLVDGARVTRAVRQGDLGTLEVRMLYDHPYGATMQGHAAVDGDTVATVARIVYAHERVTDPRIVRVNRKRFDYQGGEWLPVSAEPVT
jgi:3-hydroxyacyl-[acyl-carrier-protein] dehydratase